MTTSSLKVLSGPSRTSWGALRQPSLETLSLSQLIYQSPGWAARTLLPAPSPRSVMPAGTARRLVQAEFSPGGGAPVRGRFQANPTGSFPGRTGRSKHGNLFIYHGPALSVICFLALTPPLSFSAPKFPIPSLSSRSANRQRGSGGQKRARGHRPFCTGISGQGHGELGFPSNPLPLPPMWRSAHAPNADGDPIFRDK